MSDIVASVFRLESGRDYSVPRVGIQYVEKDTGVRWIINCGGTRAYLIRVGDVLSSDLTEQSADSHFMINRVTTALFLAGCGLFRPSAMGRFHIENIAFSELRLTTHLDLRALSDDRETGSCVSEFADWYEFICENTLFRRAADDAYAALANPVEADFYLYRGMEWLLNAASIGWQELASDIGVSFSDIRKFKRQVNADLGQRHGIESGRKRRASVDQASMVADFLQGFGNARKRVDLGFGGLTPQRAAEIVARAMATTPYP